MKKVLPLNIIGYEFKDLLKESQELAIYEHINFWMETKKYNEQSKGNYEKAIDDSNKNHTPWFVTSFIYDYCKDEIIKEIESNDYLFDKEGTILPITYHINKCGDVEKITYKVSQVKEIEVELATEEITESIDNYIVLCDRKIKWFINEKDSFNKVGNFIISLAESKGLDNYNQKHHKAINDMISVVKVNKCICAKELLEGKIEKDYDYLIVCHAYDGNTESLNFFWTNSTKEARKTLRSEATKLNIEENSELLESHFDVIIFDDILSTTSFL